MKTIKEIFCTDCDFKEKCDIMICNIKDLLEGKDVTSSSLIIVCEHCGKVLENCSRERVRFCPYCGKAYI